jgi:hypothetical protein
MINHIRTLLVNMAAVPSEEAAAGEEFIPLDFQPLVLETSLAATHNAIVPNSTGRAQRNFLAFAYLRLLHAPDFLEFVTEFDPRFTYDLDSQIFLRRESSPAQVFAFDAAAIYSRLQARVNKFEAGRGGIFRPFADQGPNLTRLRQQWHSAENIVDKLSAGILATVYQMEGARRAIRQ